MNVVNVKTGKDVTKYVVHFLEGKITRNEFEKKAKIKNKKI
jgi:hypothetical protein|tara:strand:- start:276 stop:398 length:123 start_codon:yes stop_codon:yes gene_type:complete